MAIQDFPSREAGTLSAGEVKEKEPGTTSLSKQEAVEQVQHAKPKQA